MLDVAERKLAVRWRTAVKILCKKSQDNGPCPEKRNPELGRLKMNDRPSRYKHWEEKPPKHHAAAPRYQEDCDTRRAYRESQAKLAGNRPSDVGRPQQTPRAEAYRYAPRLALQGGP